MVVERNDIRALFVDGATATDTNGNVVVGNGVDDMTQPGARHQHVARPCLVVLHHAEDSVG